MLEMTQERRRYEQPLLEIEDLHVSFPAREGLVRAVSGATFDIRPGETLGLVGESGCGKSVTAQAVLGIIPKPGKVEQGRILFHTTPAQGESDVVDIAALKPRSPAMAHIRRREVSIIMQEPMSALSPVHTIGNQIIEKIRLSSDMNAAEAKERAIGLLRRVGIPKAEQRIDTYTFELSGGMRQRAMIAMALSSDPKLLIADEPTTAVDVTIQAQILRLLRELQDELGMAILMITHDLGVVANVAHRIAVMYRGKVVERGPVLEIFEAPKHPYTRGLLASVADPGRGARAKIETIPGVVPHPYAVVHGCDFHPRCTAFIKGVCDRAVPGEVETAPGHTARCFLYADRGNHESKPE
jgi:peptide/nickel transport system ATP-binding protein